ncbi:acyl-CoA dehydrogenase family protein [Noviherbaspirillum sedimenti]|uniref:Acyl-CoA dehydrogenase/oxidase C-terminal domain-containing protein n=1 Tax=Noviherbaspirillum sedimenti TaxID=2320865 RepID=A0A3A3GIA1_9BURK|nr:acyl-CoA dehydrogenase family protein [Noviherbaspirillum sedimenti]RJG00630.1 hypothetical protein D3878_02740 [Noviherbaspirillum sedimenti]
MLDERWSSDAEEIGNALRKLLAVESAIERVRIAEGSTDGRDRALEAALDAFGLSDLEAEPDVLARIAYELGRALAPVAVVESLPALTVLRRNDVAFGFDGLVPAALPYAAVQRSDGVYIEKVLGMPRKSAAGDFLVQHQSNGDGEFIGDSAIADRLLRLMNLLDASRMVGAGQALLQYGVDYANEREQFGKKIGGFQAVAHKLVEAGIVLEGAELLVRKAAFTALERAGGDGAPAPVFSMMVLPKAIEASRLVATTVHQVFGGNGFAMEYNVQLFSRRLRSWAMRRERPGKQLAALARTMLTAEKRDAVKYLWNHDSGLPLPRWAREADRKA